MQEINEQKHIHERGQSIMLLAVVFVGFLIVVGLAIDLGLVYIERVKIARAADAAALGSVQELPNEDAAFARAVMFLKDNGYTCDLTDPALGNTTIYFNDDDEAGVPACESTDAAATFHINTLAYRELDDFNNPIPDSASRIRVEGSRLVPLNFMKFAGKDFGEVPVHGRAVAENVQDLDVAIVFDRSGSMEFDTICYGCWEVDDRDGYDYNDWPAGETYADGDGERYPLAYPHGICAGGAEPAYRTLGGSEYVIIEAEHYHQNWPPFDPDYRSNETSYWGLQRNARGSSTVGDDSGRCDGVSGERAGCGGYMQHNPYSTSNPEQVYDSSEIADAPQLTYQFQVPSTSNYRLWLKGQGGSSDGWSAGLDRRTIHWGLDNVYRGTSINFESGGSYNGASYSRWRWRQLDQFSLSANVTYTLNIWAGAAGFRLDKIVITNELNDNDADDYLRNSGSVEERKGPDATGGRSGFACWECNPIYGPPSSPACQSIWDANPQWQSMYDAMFDDQQPVRAAKEAVKLFIDPPEELENRLESEFDQVSFVSYSSNAVIDSELECVKRLGAACTSFQTVLNEVESISSGGTTNIAESLWFGIRTLMTGQEGARPDPYDEDNLFRNPGTQHYGRAGTSKFIILMTDGVPNQRPTAPCTPDDCILTCADLYDDGGQPYDCIIHYAQLARDNGIIVYTIGLGEGADEELLIEVADVTGGAYFPAPSKEDLNDIFLEILGRIYIRLVG